MATALTNPVIVVPGITASVLRDEYDLDAKRVWNIFRKHYDRVYLHPDDTHYERQEPARVRADQVFDIPYNEFINTLRHDLSPSEDRVTPVFPFAYDWRQPLDDLEIELGAFVDEVMERTALMPHYYKAGYPRKPKVNLVGHSMGGLIIAGYIERYGKDAAVDKVVTLGTPFRGSLESILKITTGLSTIGGKSESCQRELARLTPSLYHLLPSFRGAVCLEKKKQNDPNVRLSAYEPENWQPGVTKTIAEYIRLHGRDASLSKTQREKNAQTLFRTMLKGAQRHRRRTDRLDLEAAGLKSHDWLCIAGIGEKTRVRLEIRKKNKDVRFNLDSVHRKNKWKADGSVQTTDTGDGTVPFLGALPAFIPKNELVCLSDNEFGYWELADRVLEGPANVGLHGMLPKMNMAQKLTICHLLGSVHDGVVGRRAPDLHRINDTWNPPIKKLNEKPRR